MHNGTYYYFAFGKGAKYCDEYVCLSVCLRYIVLLHNLKTTWPNFLKKFMHVICGCGSVLLAQCCDDLCTSSFMNDVMFSYHGASG